MRNIRSLLVVVLFTLCVISITIQNKRVEEIPPASILEYEHEVVEQEQKYEIFTTVTVVKYVTSVPTPTATIIPTPTPFIGIDTYVDEIKGYELTFDKDLQEYLWNRCEEEDVDFYILMALICQESEYNQNVTSKKRNNGYRDHGLTQINGEYEAWYAELIGKDWIDPYDPYQSIDVLIAFTQYEINYWLRYGEMDHYTLYKCIVGSWNKGTEEMVDFVRNNGYDYVYNDYIIQRSKQLLKIHESTIQKVEESKGD